MNITIKPLTPELSDDYFDFFENRAFTDDSPYRCYCQVFQMSKEQFHAPAEMKEKAVVCFEIAPDYRGKGVATALLNQVITDAKAEGYAAVVGFPVMRDERYEWDNQGPIRLYEKIGFTKASEKDGKAVMRKELL